jgi:hypothetical protein
MPPPSGFAGYLAALLAVGKLIHNLGKVAKVSNYYRITESGL